MRLDIQQPEFSPINIVIESDAELSAFLEIFAAMTGSAEKSLGCEFGNLFSSLESVANIYGILCQNKLQTIIPHR